jgi:hypothetical protein
VHGYENTRTARGQKHRFSIEPFAGEHAYAAYLWIEPMWSEQVAVVISYVAPVFTVVDDFYVYNSTWDSYQSSWCGGDLRVSLDASPYAEIVFQAREVLAQYQVTYVPWTDPKLDDRVPLRDKADAALRDCLFNYESH